MQVDSNECVLSQPEVTGAVGERRGEAEYGGGEAWGGGGDVTLEGGAELPFGWQYRLSQGIYGAFGV
jgi:hypothetical protein